MKTYILILAILAIPLLGAPEACDTPRQPVEMPDAGPPAQAIPHLGCANPRLVAPGPDEGGDTLFVRRGDQTLGTLVTRVFIDHRNWLGDLGTGPREITQCGNLPIRITVGGTPVGGVIAFESHVVQNPSEGVIEIPLDQSYTGQVVIGYEFLHDPATGTFSCLGTCADVPLNTAREEWCHANNHPTNPDGCYDMEQGGDSPQPGFSASVTGIWTDADPGIWNP